MDVTTDKIARAYLKIRDRRSQLKREFEAQDAELLAQQDTLSAALLEVCKATGAKSIRTEAGTVIQSTKTTYWPTDWAALHKYIIEHDAMDLVQRRISQEAMKAWIAENPDDMPPGLNIDNRYTVTVRRA